MSWIRSRRFAGLGAAGPLQPRPRWRFVRPFRINGLGAGDAGSSFGLTALSGVGVAVNARCRHPSAPLCRSCPTLFSVPTPYINFSAKRAACLRAFVVGACDTAASHGSRLRCGLTYFLEASFACGACWHSFPCGALGSFGSGSPMGAFCVVYAFFVNCSVYW